MGDWRWLIAFAGRPRFMARLAQGAIPILFLLNFGLLALSFKDELGILGSELPLVYRTNHLQSATSENLKVLVYGPQMLVEDQKGTGQVVLRNTGNSAMSDINVSFVSPQGAVHMEIQEADNPNHIELEHLDPGAEYKSPFSIMTAHSLAHTRTVSIDILVEYHSGGLEGGTSPVSLDAVLLGIEGDADNRKTTSFRSQLTIGPSSTPDLRLWVRYTPPNSQQGDSATVEIEAQSLQPCIEGLGITLYAESGGEVLPSMLGDAQSNRVEFPILKQHELRRKSFELSIPDGVEYQPVLLRGNIEYNVARVEADMVTSRVLDGLSYDLSDQPGVHRACGSALRIWNGISPTLKVMTAAAGTITALIAAFWQPLLGLANWLKKHFRHSTSRDGSGGR
jgi:hypothetical protein